MLCNLQTHLRCTSFYKVLYRKSYFAVQKFIKKCHIIHLNINALQDKLHGTNSSSLNILIAPETILHQAKRSSFSLFPTSQLSNFLIKRLNKSSHTSLNLRSTTMLIHTLKSNIYLASKLCKALFNV